MPNSPRRFRQGGTVAAALKVAEKAPRGSVLLAMLPDTGERYLSTCLFDDLHESSDDEWLAEYDADSPHTSAA